MGGAREKGQVDFDLERFIDMFDEALTSQDERVVNALRSLMMMVVLTNPEGRKDSIGPLRQLFDDVHNLHRRVRDTEDTIRSMQRQKSDYYKWDELDKMKYKWSQQTSSMTFDQHLMDQLTRKINGNKI